MLVQFSHWILNCQRSVCMCVLFTLVNYKPLQNMLEFGKIEFAYGQTDDFPLCSVCVCGDVMLFTGLRCLLCGCPQWLCSILCSSEKVIYTLQHTPLIKWVNYLLSVCSSGLQRACTRPAIHPLFHFNQSKQNSEGVKELRNWKSVHERSVLTPADFSSLWSDDELYCLWL